MTPVGHKPALGALRGVAALLVVAYHFRYFSTVPWFEAIPPLAFGYLGVDFFFILSGLIISHVYFDAITSGTEGYARFFYLRIARLLPVHAFIMVVLLGGALATARPMTSQDIADWVSLILMVRQWLLPDGYAWNSPAWSISAEMFAYVVLFPLIVALTRRLSDRAAGVRLSIAGLAALNILTFDNGSINDVSGAGPLLRVTGGFLVGAGLYRLLRSLEPGRSADLLIPVGAMMALAGALARLEILALGGIAVLIAGAYLSSGPFAARLAARPLQYFGELSFSLYLCHIPVFTLAEPLAAAFSIERDALFCVIVTGAAIGVAAILHRLIEVPARSAMKNWYDRPVACRRKGETTAA